MTVKELLSRVDARELHEWAAYYSREPFGEERADLRNGILACAVLAPHLKRGRRPPTPRNFMLRFGPRREPRQNIMEHLRLATLAMGGQIVRTRNV